jgi:UDP-N-acetylglucosamine diphosphorylase / glucose-1-phosphate thymidylyltransferase / UDP-N-acetylgalactosamine diphosphorylase / glucosamine-1-phosphate N-acetyltransferase / galactosamine-1-phosphate N-acetyltransferase
MSSDNGIRTVFLCGGISRRMFPLTEDKFTLDFLGKPLLQHQIEMARAAGLSHFVFIASARNEEKIKQIAGNIPGIETDFARQEKPLGIADALKSASALLGEQFLLINPNDVFDISAYNTIISESQLLQAGNSCMLGYRVEDYFPGGYLEVNSKGNLQHIVEKPGKGNEPSDLVNILVHFHSDAKKLLEHIDAVRSNRDDVYERALDDMVKEGYRIKVVPYDNFWAPLKYPWHIFRVMEHFLETAELYVSPTASISDSAVLEGKVILGDKARVMENAVIKGPAYIGPGCIIGNNSLVRNYSHIGAGSVVGYSTEIKHSYIGDGCWFHSNYIGDSIIEGESSFGSGTITANFRLDEGTICVPVDGSRVDTGYDKLGAIVGRRCRVGVNACLMPGIRVGHDSAIGPNVCINEDLEAGKAALMKSQYSVVNNGMHLTQDKRNNLLKRL